MKKFTSLTLLILINFLFLKDSKAFDCRLINSGPKMSINSYISVPLPREIREHEQIVIDMSKFECRNDSNGKSDIKLYLTNNGVTLYPTLKKLKSGLIVNGVKYPFSTPQLVLLDLPRNGDSNYHKIPLQIYYEMGDTPGKPINISAGETMSSFGFYYTVSNFPPTNFTWWIRAGNNVYYTTGTCKINNGNDIIVDFGQIKKSSLISSGMNNINQRNVNISYRCKNPVTMPVRITLSADVSSFSSSAIMTSNENLGVETYYDGLKLAPGKSIRSNLQSGLGNAALKFNLVKKSGSDVAPGPFRGSAVLVMTAD